MSISGVMVQIKVVTVTRGSVSYEVSFDGQKPIKVVKFTPQGMGTAASLIWAPPMAQSAEAVTAINSGLARMQRQ